MRIKVTYLALLLATPGHAAVDETEFDEMQAQMNNLLRRMAALEAENAQLREAVEDAGRTREHMYAAAAKRAQGHWGDSLRINGDFRYRYEEIDIESRDVRSRHRLRARAGFVAQLPRDIEVGLRIAAGNEAPPSGNTTLGGGGSSKELFLDRAWATWRPFEGAYLTGGKMQNTFFRPVSSGLLWDSDYNPEGIAFGWSNDQLFVNVAAIALESDSNRANRTFYYGLQGGLHASLSDTITVAAGAGFIDLPVQGQTVFYGGEDDFYGNSFTCDTGGECTYNHNFEELEVFSSLTYTGFKWPLEVFAHQVSNLDADEHDSGWILGTRLGKATTAGSWQIGYQYERVEADAVFGLLRDSNVAGGGTDVRGHKLTATWAMDRQWQLAASIYVDNESGENTLGADRDFDRVVLDTVFKY
tara:strand:- start:1114 stop:2358 length:1245 start_codon:yes stop_codon:yes gene_type:complete